MKNIVTALWFGSTALVHAKALVLLAIALAPGANVNTVQQGYKNLVLS